MVLDERTISYKREYINDREIECRKNLAPGKLAFIYPDGFRKFAKVIKKASSVTKKENVIFEEFLKTTFSLPRYEFVCFKGSRHIFVYGREYGTNIFHQITNLNVIEDLEKASTRFLE
eukprot:GHVP01027159.1.p1 GENE.GHVP01027159.1~~GHVP01027159.1.p1  ORF type:complete len:118 (-),score=17.67 GHVP01027159.1:58-411(-)